MAHGAWIVRVMVGVSGALALLAASCGGSSGSFPEEAECPAPSPLATVRNQPGVISIGAYLNRLSSSADALGKLRTDLRAKYPEDTFYRRDAFRSDFAAYADQTLCVAQSLQQVPTPNARFGDADARLDAALADLIEHTRAGREAVRARNVSDYRKWFKDVDAKLAAVREAAAIQR